MNDINQHPQQRYYDDNVSLVDLATTFVRRRRVFYGVFVGVVGLAVLYATLMVGEVREYSTLIQLGEDNNKSLESPQSVIANVENRWYPELVGEYRAVNERNPPFKISAVNPENTNMIKLSSNASPELADEVEIYHGKLVDSIKARETELFNRLERELEQRIASSREYLEELSGMETNGEAQAQLIQQRARMLSEIEAMTTRVSNLKPTETLVIAREGSDNKSTSKKLILLLAIVLGLMLGIFAVFIVEFGAQVCLAMKEMGRD